MNPSQFSQFGIEDDEFFANRGKSELRELFEAVGYTFSAEVSTRGDRSVDLNGIYFGGINWVTRV